MITPFLDTAEVVSDLLHSPVLAERWDRPSALAEFRISGLAGHLARAAYTVERWVSAPAATDGSPIDAVAYYRLAAAASASGELDRQIRARGEQDAAGGPEAVAAEFDACRGRLGAVLPAMAPDRLVAVSGALGDLVLRLDQCVLSRLVELVVHLDDLAVSLDVPTPEVPAEAAEAVASCLARLAVGRHGTLPVLRVLSRRERAAGPVAAF